jgi:hypothetical protein
VIDFRYHLVSLISVFLALAVGIILGAGPLQGVLGEQLTDQVDALRSERNDLRDALSATEADADERLQFIQAAGPALVAGTLDGQRVAIVDVDDVAGDVEQGIIDQIEAAGGTVVLSAVVTPSWTDEEHAGLRDTIAAGMRPRLSAGTPKLASDAGTEETLAAALAVALADSTGGVRTEDATALEEQLVQADLLDVDGKQTEPADAVVLMSRATAPDSSPTTGATPVPIPAETAVSSMVTLARTMRTMAPVVVAGPTASSGDLVSSVRDDRGTREKVSTVSGLDTPVGRIVVPLAVAAALDDHVGQYGFEKGATPLPPVTRSTAVGSEGH